MRPLLFIGLFLLVSCGQPDIANMHSKGTSIVCFGDSLTAGFGAPETQDYPSYLRQKVKLEVINAGVSGDTTRDGLDRLQEDVLSHNPRMVIITLGANDFFQQVPQAETLRNMERIISQIQVQGAMVVWAEVKMGLLGDSYIKEIRRLAKTKKIVLIENILKDILLDPKYKSDQIHPNAEGYALMAGIIYKRVKGLVQ